MGERDDDSTSAPRKSPKTSSEVTDNPDLGSAAQGDGAAGSEKSASGGGQSDRTSKSTGGSTTSPDNGVKRGGSG